MPDDDQTSAEDTAEQSLGGPAPAERVGKAPARARPAAAPAAVPRRRSASTGVSASIAARLNDLEERLAVEPVAAADAAPTQASDVAATPKKAPRPRSTASPASSTTASPAAKAATTSTAKPTAKTTARTPSKAPRAAVTQAIPRPDAGPGAETSSSEAPDKPPVKAAKVAKSVKSPTRPASGADRSAATVVLSKADLEAALPPAPPVDVPAPVSAPAPTRTSVPRVVDTHVDSLGEGALRPRSGAVRALVALAVLLLAVAVGLGAAAVVASQAPTWEATSVVTLQTGPQPSVNRADALAAGQSRYAEMVADPSFTEKSAARAGMPDDEVRGSVSADARGGDALALDARASSRKGALALADAASLTLVAAVQGDTTAAPGDRLGAASEGPSPSARRSDPSRDDVLLAGVLAGVAVLLVAGLVLVLRRSRRS